MVNQPEPAESPAETGTPSRAWRPSRRPDYNVDHSGATAGSRVLERSHSRGAIGKIARFLRNPAVKVVIAVAFFIFAAIVYDATINGGSWTERPPRPKATAH
jgi:hypothetical protein